MDSLLLNLANLSCHIIRHHKAKKIFDLLFYLKTTIELYIKSGPAQYFSCQRFGHGFKNCGHEPRCVKCSANNLAKDSPKALEQDSTCVDYGIRLTTVKVPITFTSLNKK